MQLHVITLQNSIKVVDKSQNNSICNFCLDSTSPVLSNRSHISGLGQFSLIFRFGYEMGLKTHIFAQKAVSRGINIHVLTGENPCFNKEIHILL